MKYLVFGDVHGNLPALEKMLSTEKNNYDGLICHGDIVNYGPWSNECTDLLTQMKCVCLRGNHEEYFIRGNYNGENEVAQSFFKFCYPFFKRQQIISTFPHQYAISGFKIQHTLNDQYIYPDSDIANLNIDDNYIFGHSHHQFEKEVNNFRLYNTGSVGQNRAFINVISYLTVENEKVQMKNIKYDANTIIREMISRNYPSICINYYQNKKVL